MAEEIKTSPFVVKPNPEGAKTQNDSNNKHEITVNFPPTLNTSVSGNLQVKAETHHTKEHEQWFSNPDFYVATFTGLLVFVTALLVCFTRGLMVYTRKLWGATDTLVVDAKEASKKQLRAYVAIPADGLNPAGLNQAGNTPRMRIWNFGKTPAYRTSIRSGTCKNVASIDAQGRKFILRGHLLSPGNHVAINFPPEVPTIPTRAEDSFCIHGDIEYTDIYDDRWRMHFVWEWGDHGETTHNFMPHHTGNYEEYVGKDPESKRQKADLSSA